jgi:NAD(P)-dependent dehydrogenase (short-subunit alcohol dehydrogenase family)
MNINSQDTAVNQTSLEMTNERKTAIVTGGSQGIGAGIVKAFLNRGYNVVANSRNINITKSSAFEASDKLALVDGSIAEPATAAMIAEVAKSKFGSIDALVNNAGIYFSKPFIDYTLDDLRSLISVNIEGFFFISQLAIKQMLAQKTGGSIVNITTTLADHPIAGINVAVPMITKGGLDAVTRSLAMEYAKQGIRVNAVAPGIVDTPMHKDDPQDFLKTLQPMGQISDVKDIVDAIVYLTEAGQVTGEVLHVDGGAHIGRW